MAERIARLRKFFVTVAKGQRAIRNVADGTLFLNAVYAQDDRVQCIVTLLSERHASQALLKSLRLDVSDAYLNGAVADVIMHLVNEEVRQLNGGALLRDLLQAILDPPLLFDSLQDAAHKHRLSERGIHAWAALLLELLLVIKPSSELWTKLGVLAAANALLKRDGVLDSSSHDIRQLGYKIHSALKTSTCSTLSSANLEMKPGGRHDNDFEDFRKIAIFPTTDELLTSEPPFILTADAVFTTHPSDCATVHLANQFRLLREDMLAELREDLVRASDTKRPRKRGLKLSQLQFTGIEAGASSTLRPAAIAVRCFDSMFKNLPEDEDQRRKYFTKDKSIVKHGSFGCLKAGNDIMAFAVIHRDEELLAKKPPVVLFRVTNVLALRTALWMFKSRGPHEIYFVSIETPFFAYEPVLTRLQALSSLPLADVILNLDEEERGLTSSLDLEDLAFEISKNVQADLRAVLDLPKEVKLDHAQTASLVAGLRQSVSAILGPPGTGKSFIGAILAAILIQHTTETVLVLCYTNHALDQFLEDIMDMGVPESHVLRLGSKSTARTKALTLYEQRNGQHKVPNPAWRLSKSYLAAAEDDAKELHIQGNQFSKWRMSEADLLDSLEFADEEEPFFEAFSVPDSSDDMETVGKNNKAIESTYLINRWVHGKNAGIFQAGKGSAFPGVWDMTPPTRGQYYNRWMKVAAMDRVDMLCASVAEYDKGYEKWAQQREERDTAIMKSKRLIGCTTTAAAKYANQLASARPGIIIVEEAGEVLESHVLTAMSNDTKQLVLIGDHKQLRPKANNYKLTVEGGEGYDLNRSLFERLVLGGHPHSVLREQHRMRPEISALVRQLTYPDLQDGKSTLSRPDVRGLQSNVVFINHSELEVSDERLKDKRDPSVTSSRRNPHEADMVLKIVRYLAQQGYGTDNQVVLTPYLGQLRHLLDTLQADHDPVLNDLDSADLVKAGLLTPASASHAKRSLRISTVDNFQGEESDIVIVSLTRSNERGDIGFLKEPQRLNVLLSRARNGLIIIGNADTFRRSKAGSGIWNPFFEQLIDNGHFFDGLPVRCEQHPDKCRVLRTPEDFATHCPDGGCELPCGAKLKCGKHSCPERCHQLVDHSKMKCIQIEKSKCPQDHDIMWECWEISKPCHRCEKAKKEQEARLRRDLKLAESRERKARDYQQKLMALDSEILDQRQINIDRQDDENRERALEQKRQDLSQAKTLTQERKRDSSSPDSGKVGALKERKLCKRQKNDTTSSAAADRWEYQKLHEGAVNDSLDALMNLIGLESVKNQVLRVKDKIDMTVRQGCSLEKERFGVILLGNPGIGKTTVARLYAKFLASTGAVAGSMVEETTASRLTSGGLPAYRKIVEKVQNGGGGAVFIDEAYQLGTGSTGPSPVGSQILDAVLDDAENLRGKVVFILAGYRREMENVLVHNPGLPSRFPDEFSFEDYTDDELHRILQKQMRDWSDRIQVDGGSDGLYCRIVARRVGYGRGRPGFGNARAVENAYSRIRARQAARVTKARRAGQPWDDFQYTKEDLIGPEPSNALGDSKAWAIIQSMIGLSEVKESINALMQSVNSNYERELREEARLEFNLNRVFLGSPGTGKTTIAKLYGRVLADIGLLSNGEVIVKNPSDFIGDALGVSEKKTRAILESTKGKVLVIDEAYSLCSSPASSGQVDDPYRTAVIDTLVAEIQSVPGEDRCVLLLGYQEQMQDMMQKVNPGLTRRFPLSEAFVFEDFSDDDLEKIVELKLKLQAYTTTPQAMSTIMDVLQRARNKPNFGNAGEVDIILNSAKGRHQRRICKGSAHNTILEAVDIDPDFDRTEKNAISVQALFKDTVGNEEVISRLEAIQKAASAMRARGLDVRGVVPFNFVFAGPPGTGKTTTARKMGQIYYDMGILGSNEVVEVSATELVGQYVGQTGPKTQKLLEKALGKVLFIDEAYRLAEGAFAKEAIDEIVDRLTKPQFAKRLIVIFAGYNKDIERLMGVNAGLRSRFPETVTFHSFKPQDCVALLMCRLESEDFLDVSDLRKQSKTFTDSTLARFELLTKLDGWANARDVGTLAKTIATKKLYNAEPDSTARLVVSPEDVLDCLDGEIRERQQRVEMATRLAGTLPVLHLQQQSPGVQDPRSTTMTQTKMNSQEVVTSLTEATPCEDGELAAAPMNHRDAGVSDTVWAQLEMDKQKGIEQEREYEELVTHLATLEQKKAEEEAEELAESTGPEDDSAEDVGEKRRMELERIAREHARRHQDLELEAARRKRAEMEREREKERQAQRKLRQMGVCVAGFRWIKQASGYRCAGGSHFIPDEALNAVL